MAEHDDVDWYGIVTDCPFDAVQYAIDCEEEWS